MNEINWSEVQKSLDEAASKVADYARNEAHSKGTPIYVEDDDGHWIKEYPDGRRSRIVRDETGEREIPLAAACLYKGEPLRFLDSRLCTKETKIYSPE